MMENNTTQSLYLCGCCRRELPVKAFYMNKRTRRPDNYCKECRKANSGKHRIAVSQFMRSGSSNAS